MCKFLTLGSNIRYLYVSKALDLGSFLAKFRFMKVRCLDPFKGALALWLILGVSPSQTFAANLGSDVEFAKGFGVRTFAVKANYDPSAPHRPAILVLNANTGEAGVGNPDALERTLALDLLKAKHDASEIIFVRGKTNDEIRKGLESALSDPAVEVSAFHLVSHGKSEAIVGNFFERFRVDLKES